MHTLRYHSYGGELDTDTPGQVLTRESESATTVEHLALPGITSRRLLKLRTMLGNANMHTRSGGMHRNMKTMLPAGVGTAQSVLKELWINIGQGIVTFLRYQVRLNSLGTLHDPSLNLMHSLSWAV
jgi:hypothetical protein